ncbi:transcriptional repressor [Chelatococcus daeguensis]|nr:transcriptional repressor [Chelatococcus daeguensis]
MTVKAGPTTEADSDAMDENEAGHGHDHHHGDDADCAHAAARLKEAPAALDAAEAACRTRGQRLTPIRRAVLETLYATHRPLGAYDLAEALTQQDERRVAPITIYRALDFLLEQGFVHKLETKNAFVACPHHHEPGELVVFLICEACGGVDEAASPDVGSALRRVLTDAAFKPRAQVVEIAGTCAHCREGAKGESQALT